MILGRPKRKTTDRYLNVLYYNLIIFVSYQDKNKAINVSFSIDITTIMLLNCIIQMYWNHVTPTVSSGKK